jgi:hypothetical protein
MHLALALGSLAFSTGALIYVIISGRRTARLNAQTTATWEQVAELTAQTRADQAAADQIRWSLHGRG